MLISYRYSEFAGTNSDFGIQCNFYQTNRISSYNTLTLTETQSISLCSCHSYPQLWKHNSIHSVYIQYSECTECILNVCIMGILLSKYKKMYQLTIASANLIVSRTILSIWEWEVSRKSWLFFGWQFFWTYNLLFLYIAQAKMQMQCYFLEWC